MPQFSPYGPTTNGISATPGGPGGQAGGTSLFSWWRPANLLNLRASPIVKAVQGLLRGRDHDPSRTTQMGAPATAAPSMWGFNLLAQRYERQAILSDIAKLLQDDPRLAKMNKKMAREATRKGVVVTVDGRDGVGDDVAEKAQAVIDQINSEALVNRLLFKAARSLLADGDLFWQVVLDDAKTRVVGVAQMPAASMEKNTDERGIFPNLMKAYTQYDTVTQTTVSDFAAWQIAHVAWNQIGDMRYGESEYLQCRAPGRLLMLMEQAQVIRRLTRATQKMHHHVGTPEKPGTDEDRLKYQQDNSLAGNPAAVWDPLRQVLNYFGNGLTKIDVLKGDETVHQIDDIRYMQDVYVLGGGVPKGVVGLDAESINRDVLKDQRAEWLKETVALSDALGDGLLAIYQLGLMLAGLNPDAVTIKIRWSEGNVESASDRADRIIKLRQANIGAGKNAIPSPLISEKTALAALAEDNTIGDVDAEITAIHEELDATAEDRDAAGATPDTITKLADVHGSAEGFELVCVAVTSMDGRLLLVQRAAAETSRPGEWECPGGHVDPGEPLHIAACREVLEETGLLVAIGNERVPFHAGEGRKGVLLRGYLVGPEAVALNYREHQNYQWVLPQAVGIVTPTPRGFAAQIRQLIGPTATPTTHVHTYHAGATPPHTGGRNGSNGQKEPAR